MTEQQINALAKRWRELFEKSETDQWELAEIAYQATDIEGMTANEFGELVGRAKRTINSYRAAWKHRLASGHPDAPFAEVVVLATSSPERQAALHAVADSNGITLSQAKNKTDEIAYFKSIFQTVDSDVLKGALKDQDARSRLRELSVEAVMEDQPKRPAPTGDAGGDKPTAKAPTPEEQSAKIQLQRSMAELMHANRATQQRFALARDAFLASVPNLWWNKQFPGETVHRTHGEQVLGDLDKTIAVLTETRALFVTAIAEADAEAEKVRQRELDRTA